MGLGAVVAAVAVVPHFWGEPVKRGRPPQTGDLGAPVVVLGQ